MRRRSRTTTPSRSHNLGRAVDLSCCVAEVMGTDLFTLTPDTVVASALRLASTKRIDHFLVIEDGNLTGIVCQNDLKQARQTTLIGDCMTSPVLCIGPETTLGEAVSIMDENAVGCLPVITGAFLVGMITRDRLGAAGGEVPRARRIDLEDEVTPPEPKPCAACGSNDGVQPRLMAGMLLLCGECAGSFPAPEPAKGN